jgi:predicted RNA polymerase sigma factor
LPPPALAQAPLALTLREVCGLKTEKSHPPSHHPATIACIARKAKTACGYSHQVPSIADLPERVDWCLSDPSGIQRHRRRPASRSRGRLSKGDPAGALLSEMPDPGVGLSAMLLQSRACGVSTAEGDRCSTDQDRRSGTASKSLKARRRRAGFSPAQAPTIQAAIAPCIPTIATATTDWTQIAAYDLLVARCHRRHRR